MYLNKIRYALIFLLVIFLLAKLIKLALVCLAIFILLLVIDSLMNPKPKEENIDPHKKEPIYLKGETKKDEDDLFPNLDNVDDLAILDEIFDDEE